MNRKQQISQRVKTEIDKCISNVYIYNDSRDIDQKLIHIESTYLRICLENKNVKKQEIDEAVKVFCENFGFAPPK